MSIDLNLLKYQSQLQLRKDKRLFDPIRKKWIVITPEELVRQMLLLYMMEEKDFPKNKINVEKQVLVNGQPKRFDILVYSKETKPILLVECKAPNVPIDEMVLDQIARYNMVLKVNYLIMTNGIDTFCCQVDYEKETFEILNEIPNFKKL
jgi:hypothetical protein